MGAMSEVGNSNSTNKPGAATAAASELPAVTNRKANTKGFVIVTMFHHLGDHKGDLFVTKDKFLYYLNELDQMGFRPVTAKEYLNDKMDIPRGATPVVMTFDDANPDQLRLLKDGTVDPNCFVGIWQGFAKTHPEFPVHGTFFVLPNFFDQPEFHKQKLKILQDLGCEVANHTLTHPDLFKLTDAQVEHEIGGMQKMLEGMGVQAPMPLAVPYGIRPKNHKLLQGFTYENEQIAPLGVFMVGAGPAPSPLSNNFDRYHIPRVAGGDEFMDLQYWLDRIKDGKVHMFVQP